MELVLWNVGRRGCGRVFAPLLEMFGLSGKRRNRPERATGGAALEEANLAGQSVALLHRARP